MITNMGRRLIYLNKVFVSKFVDATTNKGKAPQSIIYMERPADSTPMKVHTVAPVTNEGYFLKPLQS